jgi:hypothetical protein
MRGHEIMQESRGLPLELGSLRRVVMVEFPKPCLATIVQFEGALGHQTGLTCAAPSLLSTDIESLSFRHLLYILS